MSSTPSGSRNADKLSALRKAASCITLICLLGSLLSVVLGSPDIAETIIDYGSCLFPAADIEVEKDLQYAGQGKTVQKGDLYRASELAGKTLPAVVLVDGGSWSKGSKQELSEISLARIFARSGYLAFNIDYSMIADGGFPKDIVDVKNALSYLVANSQKLKIDPARIFLLGSSSGASAALLAAYTTVENQFPQDSVFKDSVCSVRAVASLSGPTDFAELANNPYLKEYLHCKEKIPSAKLLAEASPVSYVATAVPTIFVHGKEDRNVPYEQSAALARLLSREHIPACIISVDGAGHFMGVSSRNAALAHVFKFFHEHDPGQP